MRMLKTYKGELSTQNMVAFHLSGMVSQFENGMYEFSELLVARIA